VNRFVVDPGQMTGDRFPLPEQIRHQVAHVLRLRAGDRVTLLDGSGGMADCRIVEGGAWLEVAERGPAGNEPTHRLTLCQALLKGDGVERVVRQGTELGVARFRLVIAERCVPRELSARRLARLRAIAREATEQSERGMVPAIDDPVVLVEVLDAEATVLYERGEGSIPRLAEIAPPPGTLVIGPEGGFAAEEIRLARARGASLASLGPRILRAESVAIAATAVVLSRTGDFA
jgi:16S rRNA (uracil1498-N3)-methyltransferase